MSELGSRPNRFFMVAEDSQLYTEGRDITRRLYSPSQYSFVFGTRTLDTIAHYRSRYRTRNGITKPEADEMIKDTLQETREKLKVLYQDDELKPHVKQFAFNPFLSWSAYSRHLTQKKYGRDYFEVEDIFDADVIPDYYFIYMIQRHVWGFRARERAFKEKLPGLKADFKERMAKAIGEGVIPLAKQTVDRRIRQTNVRLADPLHTRYNGGGQYKIPIGTICIVDHPKDADENWLKRIYAHEMLHALSGRRILGETIAVVPIQEREPETIEGIPAYISHLHGGFFIFGEENRYYFWLNEAETTLLQMYLFNTGEDKSYGKERELLKFLLSSGTTNLDPQLFINAYFENFDPTTERGQEMPARKALFKAVRGAYNPGFLARLDQLVRTDETHGIDIAIAQMKSDWKQI